MRIVFDTSSIDSYREFMAVKRLPAYRIHGRVASFPDEYADRIGKSRTKQRKSAYEPERWLFDYQAAITERAIQKQKYAVFAECGLGKTCIMLSYAMHVLRREGGRVLILTPPLVVQQVIEEAKSFYGEQVPIRALKANQLAEWLTGDGDEIGVTNYEALKDSTPQGNLKCLILDESSILKSHYGKYGGICIRLGKGLKWKLCLTGTPAPNDRMEYANHAVYLDRFPTINSFLAKYFINRGQTDNRWELKPHALKPFYRSLSDWCIFLTDPSTYGWRDNVHAVPPIITHVHEVELTKQQRDWMVKETGSMVATRSGGVTKRSSYGQVAKGWYKKQWFDTNKPAVIKALVDSWKDSESTLVWCKYDKEQTLVEEALREHMESMDGSTPWNVRGEMIRRFKAGETATLISKPALLGFGLNLQVATRQVFSALEDSYEKYWQCIKRSNRIKSVHPLNVHIPVTELEYPMVENVLRKKDRVDADTREQEQIFIDASRKD